MQYRQDIVCYTNAHYADEVIVTISIVKPYEVFGTTLRTISYILENFQRQIAILVAPPTDGSI